MAGDLLLNFKACCEMHAFKLFRNGRHTRQQKAGASWTRNYTSEL